MCIPHFPSPSISSSFFRSPCSLSLYHSGFLLIIGLTWATTCPLQTFKMTAKMRKLRFSRGKSPNCPTTSAESRRQKTFQISAHPLALNKFILRQNEINRFYNHMATEWLVVNNECVIRLFISCLVRMSAKLLKKPRKKRYKTANLPLLNRESRFLVFFGQNSRPDSPPISRFLGRFKQAINTCKHCSIYVHTNT